jgi:DNA repair protein RecN (Recombination protein N)
MLQRLKIKNYALIDNIDIDFYPGFLTITGETGAGKSILIGALSLILGNRADTSMLKNSSDKCVIEAHFLIKQYKLNGFFEKNDIDYDDETIIRREINNKGKSRAFVNDTPVNVKLLKEIGDYLVDIHSQHHNLFLQDNIFQLNVIDAYSSTKDLLEDYQRHYKIYKELQGKYRERKELAEKNKNDLDYYQYQFEMLEKLNLVEGEQDELENESDTLNHTEDIKYNLASAHQLLNNEEVSILSQLKEAVDNIKKIVDYFPKVKDVNARLDSVYIELQDLAGEIEMMNESVEYDPERLEFIRQRLDDIYDLEHKHNVSTVEELIKVKQDLEKKIDGINNADFELEELLKELNNEEEKLEKLAAGLTNKRKQNFTPLKKRITSMLKDLGIPNATFEIIHETTKEYKPYGKDNIQFLFSANKNVPPENISKVASGGELSRLMLTLKALIAEKTALPTIIFDEIDSGTSGDIADKMGTIMEQMANNMQVINITHLPQIASKGHHHYLVYKSDEKDTTYTDIAELNDDQRLKEIAKMLSGEQLTDTSLQHAKEFLGRS